MGEAKHKSKAHLVHIDTLRSINLCLHIKQLLHVISKGLWPRALLLAAEQQHVVSGPAAVAGRDHVQKGNEVLAHSRRQLFGQAKV